jgi:transcriptional regulator with XRE-family HTH domain
MTRDIAAVFATQIRERRIAKGWTQVDVAERGKFHPTQIDHYEHRRRTPTLRTVVRFANALGCSAADLLDPRTADSTQEDAQ